MTGKVYVRKLAQYWFEHQFNNVFKQIRKTDKGQNIFDIVLFGLDSALSLQIKKKIFKQQTTKNNLTLLSQIEV